MRVQVSFRRVAAPSGAAGRDRLDRGCDPARRRTIAPMTRTEERSVADDLVEMVVTAPDAELLAGLSRELVEQRLCAAAHVLGEVRSIYRWQDALTENTEARAWLRCRREAVDAVVAHIRAGHPHQVPSIIAYSIAAGDPQYLAWIAAQTTSSA
jgi:periplasmic divalent cation tolerance protein